MAAEICNFSYDGVRAMKNFTRKERAFFQKLSGNEYNSTFNRHTLMGLGMAVVTAGAVLMIGVYAFQM